MTEHDDPTLRAARAPAQEATGADLRRVTTFTRGELPKRNYKPVNTRTTKLVFGRSQ